MSKVTVDTYTFNVAVSIGVNKTPIFTYYEPGNPKPLTKEETVVTVSGPTIIFYKLINLDLAPKGLRFIGAAFKTPFDGVIENTFVSESGDTLVLEDLCLDDGESGFHLLLKTDENNLVMMSPDPQVINKKI